MGKARKMETYRQPNECADNYWILRIVIKLLIVGLHNRIRNLYVEADGQELNIAE
jgi:hypothetical protein